MFDCSTEEKKTPRKSVGLIVDVQEKHTPSNKKNVLYIKKVKDL